MVLNFEDVLGEVLGYKVRVKKSDYYVLESFYLSDIDSVSQFREYFNTNRFDIIECKKVETQTEESYDLLIKVKDYRK